MDEYSISCLTSFFAGFVIFGVIGFMAHELGQPVEDVVKQGRVEQALLQLTADLLIRVAIFEATVAHHCIYAGSPCSGPIGVKHSFLALLTFFLFVKK